MMRDDDVPDKFNIMNPETLSPGVPIITDETAVLFSWIVSGALCQIIAVFGIGTNIINLICFVKQGFEDPVNVSLLGLSVSDLGCLITQCGINICITPALKAADLSFESTEVGYLCVCLPHFVFSRVTNWITAVITVERSLCVLAPLKIKEIVTPKLTGAIIIFVYIISICSTAPLYVVNRLGWKFNPLRNRTILGLVFMEDQETVEVVSYTINNFSIPMAAFIVIVASTVTLSMGLRKASEWNKKSAQVQCDKVYKRNQKITKMVVMISTLFIVCFIPFNTLMVVMAFEPELSYGGKHLNVSIILGGLGVVLESINSSVNIFIYYHMSSNYRDTLRQILWKQPRK